MKCRQHNSANLVKSVFCKDSVRISLLFYQRAIKILKIVNFLILERRPKLSIKGKQIVSTE